MSGLLQNNPVEGERGVAEMKLDWPCVGNC